MIRTAAIVALVGSVLAVTPPALPVAVPLFLNATQKAQVARLAAEAVKFRLEQPQHNWSHTDGSGSCAWASTINLLRWQQKPELANWLKAHYGGAADPDSIHAALDQAKIPYAETRTGDEQLLEWAARTRRGACVVVDGGSHMINLVGLDKDQAWLLGNVTQPYVHARPRAEFIADWKQAGGWAFTPLYAPPAPQPWLIRRKDGAL